MLHFSLPAKLVTTDVCAVDRHRPRRGSERQDGYSRRAVCRGCGCALVRTDATCRWIRSGMLG